MNTILVTGGTGYIGSHGVVSLIEKGYKVVIIDNLSNSDISTLENIEKITGEDIKYSISSRRSGDIATSYCNPKKANDLLEWQAKYSTEEAIEDSWEFIKKL